MEKIILQGITAEDLSKLVAIEVKRVLSDVTTPSEQVEQKELLTRQETADLLNINVATLWRYTKKGKLKSYGIGNRVYYKLSEVLESVKLLNPIKE